MQRVQGNIEYIPIDKIKPHPQNPRKNLGDLTELTDSIKKSGIYQNLTVISNGDETYTAIIGHRRLAAAKKAGLKQLPCVVVVMDEKEQLSTMLLENMQREDLTVIEQAEGFQMMIDLGEDVKSISDQTGFSQSTVRHRLKLNELDHKKLEKANERANGHISINDYILLEKIKDIDTRNRMIKYLGAPEFEYQVNKEIGIQKKKELENKFKELFIDLKYIDITDEKCRYNNYGTISSFIVNETNFKDYSRPKSVSEDEQLYFAIDYGWIYIYKEKDNAKEKAEDAKREKAEANRKAKLAKLEDISKRVKKDIYRFVGDYKNKNDKSIEIMRLFLFCNIKDVYQEINIDGIIDDVNSVHEESTLEDLEPALVSDEAILRMTIDTFMHFQPFSGYNGEFYEHTKEINHAILTTLRKIGYNSSEEVFQFFDGSLEAYKV